MQYRKVIDALLPPGSLWVPEDDRDLDKLLDGVSASGEAYRIDMADLANLRDAQKTPLLDDLETEYGLVSGALSETDRRDRLSAAITSGGGDGTAEFLESQLRKAGFDIYVHVNDPPVDPSLFLFAGGGAITGNENAICGRTDAYTSNSGDFLAIVNGDILDSSYDIPTDPGYWPSIFFVGGLATRDGSGAITGIAHAEVDIARKDELFATVVKHKPVWTWGGPVIDYVAGG